jgi:hypothetical protein
VCWQVTAGAAAAAARCTARATGHATARARAHARRQLGPATGVWAQDRAARCGARGAALLLGRRAPAAAQPARARCVTHGRARRHRQAAGGTGRD